MQYFKVRHVITRIVMVKAENEDSARERVEDELLEPECEISCQVIGDYADVNDQRIEMAKKLADVVIED
jgi:hypothetical protein